jgi:hypothetical protein
MKTTIALIIKFIDTMLQPGKRLYDVWHSGFLDCGYYSVCGHGSELSVEICSSCRGGAM